MPGAYRTAQRNTYPRARDLISLRQLPRVFRGPLAPNSSFFLGLRFLYLELPIVQAVAYLMRDTYLD
jgi:hypothetical protein